MWKFVLVFQLVQLQEENILRQGMKRNRPTTHILVRALRHEEECQFCFLTHSFSLSYLYSNNPSYSISTNTLDNSTSTSFNNFVIGIIKIDKLKLDYPILSEESEELLKIAPCRFAGPLPNEIGNLCIAGHNYIDNTFFARISSLTFGDEIKIYGIDGNLVKYSVFNKTEVESSDLSCTEQNTYGKRIVTLMTCNSIKQTRIIIQAVEV